MPNELFSVRVFGGPARGPLDAVPVPEGDTLLSYMFLHGDIFHLAGNMLFLWVFGDNVEDALGHLRFLVFYILCGVAAALFHAALQPASAVPLIGASGAVAGVIAAYLILHPHVRVWVVAFRVIPLRIYGPVRTGGLDPHAARDGLLPQVGPVAWWAHIGGLITGAILVVFMRRPGGAAVRPGLCSLRCGPCRAAFRATTDL